MCGIIGVFGDSAASAVACAGMQTMQHRGTAACGMAAWVNNAIVRERGAGLVTQVFPDLHEHRPYNSRKVIGHLRYPTSGGASLECAQPHEVGRVVHCSNGDTPDYLGARARAIADGIREPQTCNDSELATSMLEFGYRTTRHDLTAAVRYVMKNLPGAYSSVAIVDGHAIAFRDPWGFRPMVYGKLPSGGWAVASETVALEYIGATDVTFVRPGEMLHFAGQGRELQHAQVVPSKPWCFCFFELVYFAYPSTRIFGKEVGSVREEIGARLWKEESCKFSPETVVMSVPDSANHYADGYAAESSLRRVQWFIRRHFKGRTFILAEDRIAAVLAKFDFLRDKLYGAKVVLLDDSIVRGTTMVTLIRVLRERYGVREVHIRVGSPPNLSPCHYGIDTPTNAELLAWQAWNAARSSLPDGTKPTDEAAVKAITEEMRQRINADSLRFVSHDGLMQCLPNKGYCTGCITGDYPSLTA